MNIKTELEQLSKADIYSLMLFAMYKVNEAPEYAALSQLAYIVDKDNLLRLCQYYGGQTISIPTVEELESFLTALLLFQQVDIEHQDYDLAVKKLVAKGTDSDILVRNYKIVRELLKNYNFNSGRN